MNIYDALPIKFIKWAAANEMQLTLGKDYIDLNTGMKSGLHLYYENGKYVAKMRYDREVVIKYFSDLHYALKDCMCGRTFMDSSVIKLFNEGFGYIQHDKFC